MAPTPEHPLIGQVLQDTYRVERLIGQGGMGAVYEASHKRLPRRFAIKVLSPAVLGFPEAVARFRREAEIASALGHPHIIEVVDFHETGSGMPYIVMEFLDGEDLATLLTRSPRLEIARSAAIVEQVSSALQAAHKRGVIHRDLKPSNIFLCRQPDDTAEVDLVKVVDFGISKVVGSTSLVTQAQATMGTPFYMSPEQAEGRSAEVDARTDIFSLGTILYEMLTGCAPFAAETVPAVLYRVVHHDPADICEQRPEVPAALAGAIAHAMRKAPEERFASVAEFAAALKEAITGAEAAASSPPARFTASAAAAEQAVAQTLPASAPLSADAGPRAQSAAATAAAPAAVASPQPAVAEERTLVGEGAGGTTLSGGAAEVVDGPLTLRGLDRGLTARRVALAVAGLSVLVAGGIVLLRGLGSSGAPGTGNASSVAAQPRPEGPTADGPTPVRAAAPAIPGDGPALAAVAADARRPPAEAPPQRANSPQTRTRRIKVHTEIKSVVCSLTPPGERKGPCEFEVPQGSRVTLAITGGDYVETVSLTVIGDRHVRFPSRRALRRHPAARAPTTAKKPAAKTHPPAPPDVPAKKPKRTDWGEGTSW